MSYFTVYWTNETWRAEKEFNPTGKPIDFSASTRFRRSGIQKGDTVYFITVLGGLLYVAGKMRVGIVCDNVEAERLSGITDLSPLEDFILASDATTVNWNRMLPLKVTEMLKFESKTASDLTFESPGILDNQTLRGIRRLTTDSAMLIDRYLGKTVKVSWRRTAKQSLWVSESAKESPETELESFADGKKKTKFVSYFERDPRNRAEAIRIHGLDCKGCGINFETAYGPLGNGFIHVHHIQPVSQYSAPTKINPKLDLTVLCPNCHAMVHKNKTTTLSVAELRKIINDNRTRKTRTR